MTSLCLPMIATVLLGLALASCGSEPPTAPTPPSGPPAASLVRVELVAPGSIAPGESVQLSANAVKSDGSVENVSARAQWTSSDRSVLDISSTGLATGATRGEAFIRVVYQSRSASATAFVLPAGTYRLQGTVTDSGIRLSEVTVAVIDGVGDELTTATDANGRYELYGVAGRVRVQATGSGYFDQIQEIDVADHRTFDFEMRSERPRADVRGDYRLTIDRAACSNPAPFPATRSYDAVVDQDEHRLTVTLSGAEFVITGGRGNGFTGVIDGADRVRFAVGSTDQYYYEYRDHDLVERLSPTQVLIISGSVTARLSPAGIAGTLSGGFFLAAGTSGPFTVFQAGCYGAAHRFEMVRR